jgi:epoxyqueuosine reductase QueG
MGAQLEESREQYEDGGETPMRCLSRELVHGLALEAGFAEAGLIALPHDNEERDAARFEEWVRAGRAGSMHYLERTDERGRLLRSRVAIPFPWARSVVVCWPTTTARSRARLSRLPRARDGLRATRGRAGVKMRKGRGAGGGPAIITRCC